MKDSPRKFSKSGSQLLLPLLLALGLSACGPSFEEGVYADARFGTSYEFAAGGQGRLVGGVPGAPTFTYTVESDQVVVSYGQGQPEALFKRVDGRTLERHDGTRLVLRE